MTKTRWNASDALIAGAILVAAIGALMVVRLAGGTPTPLNHLGYAPILVAAYRFGWRGGVAVGSLTTVLLGPAAQMLSLPGEIEPPTAWLVRGAFFIAIGGITGLLIDRVRQGRATTTDQERELHAIIANTTDALLVSDDDRRYVAANPAASRLLGLSPEQLLGRRVDDFLPEADANTVEALWADFLEAGSQRGEMTLRRADGDDVFVDYAAVARYLPGRHLSILRDITKRKTTEAQLERSALFDPLTDLPNTTLLHDRLRLAVRQARQANSEVALVHLGIDGFKPLNEALGRPAGDHVLRVVTDRLMATTREGDSVARVGGDEFAVVLGEPINAEQAWMAAGRILLAVAEPMQIPDAEAPAVSVKASAGLARFPTDATDETGLLRAADLARHTAKRRGVGLAVYTNEEDGAARSKWTRMMGLRQALSDDELVLHYQPVFRAADLELISAEALVRWQHPTDGLLGPNEFIPLAEGAGLIDELARVVTRKAVQQAAAWSSAGTPLRTAVNLSPLNLRNPSVLQFAMAALDEAGLDPALLELEITESAFMEADESTMEHLARIHELGVQIAIDDFGTGYSSLGSLRSLPIDKLKLDRSFISGWRDNHADRMIVRSMVELAHNMNLEVIAEGVEDRATLVLLQVIHCDAVQGYLTGRPVPAEAFRWAADVDS